MEQAEIYSGIFLTAGCDEAGRGCVSGPVFAGAVIFPVGYNNPRINDSKKLPEELRNELAVEIKKNAVSYGIGFASVEEIDSINILNASFLAMHRAISFLDPQPEYLLIDGNRFRQYTDLPYSCIIGGDSKILSIAAASVLAKTARDDYMKNLHMDFPVYGWNRNKGYPTLFHANAIREYGRSPHHRKSFCIKGQLKIKFETI